MQTVNGHAQENGRHRKLLASYGILLVLGVVAYLAIRGAGAHLSAPPPTGPSRFGGGAPAHGAAGPLALLISLATIMVAARVLGALFRRLGQPPVIGEVVAGILLGPTLLGQIAPGATEWLFPSSVMPLLGTLAQIGILLFMFDVGLELDLGVLKREGHTMVVISHASIVVPFVLGAGMALWLYPLLSTSDVPFLAFSLFLGISLSVTAFPVLARILAEQRLDGTTMGSVALVSAALGDVTAWCLLALVVGVTQSRLDSALWTAGLSFLYIAAMLVLVRPLVRRYVERWEGRASVDQPMLALVCIMLLLSSMATEFIGIHTLFGAFLLGAIIPHDSAVARGLRARLHDLVVVMFLPAFFAFSGLRTEIALIQGSQWWICLAIIGVACLGKFGGSAVAARMAGLSWRDSSAIGILMNTRGLMELIVLNIGLDLGVISPTLFAMLVLMAVVTTMMTSPVLQLLMRRAPAAA